MRQAPIPRESPALPVSPGGLGGDLGDDLGWNGGSAALLRGEASSWEGPGCVMALGGEPPSSLLRRQDAVDIDPALR